MDNSPTKMIVPASIYVASWLPTLAQVTAWMQVVALAIGIVSGAVTAYRGYHWYRYERKR